MKCVIARPDPLNWYRCRHFSAL